MTLQRAQGLQADQAMHMLLVFFFLLPFVGWAQKSADTLRAARAFKKAESLREAAQYDSSSTYFTKAAKLFEQARAWKRKVDALYKLSLNKSDQGQLDEASQYINQALAICKRYRLGDHSFQLKALYQRGAIASSRADYNSALQWYHQALVRVDSSASDIPIKIKLTVGIGDVYDGQGKYAEALRQYREAEDLYLRHHLRDQKLLSRIYSGFGISYHHNGQEDASLTYHQKALKIDRKILPAEHPDLAKDYNNIAIVYYYRSDYQRALDYMKNSVNVLRKFYGEDHKTVAAGYNNVGVVYSEMGKLKEATEYLKKALAIKKKILGPDHPDITVGYQNLGAIYFDMKKYDEAIAYYEKAKALSLKHFPNGHPKQADIYNNLGQAYARKGQYQKALDYYRKDLNTNLKFLSSTHPLIGDTYNKIGETYSKLKNYTAALNYFKKALPIFVKGYSAEAGLQNPSLEQIVYPEKLLKTLELKAGALESYSGQQGEATLLDQSLHTYLQAVQLIEKLQYSLTREGSKFVLRKRTHDIYQKGFRAAFTLARQTGKSDYKEYALYFAEKSKDQILLEQLQETNAEHFADIPDSLIRRGNVLETHLTKLQEKLRSLTGSPQQSDSLKRIALEDSLFDTQRAFEKHVQGLEQSYPNYYKLKYQHTAFPSWKIQQQLLSQDQTMIEYFMGADSLYALVISKKRFDLRKVGSDSLLGKEIHRYRKAITQSSSVADFATQSHRLYQKLFAPLADIIKGRRLLIIPDESLNLLPFESLVSEYHRKNKPGRFKTLSYLVDNYVISYAPSAAYLDVSRQMKEPDHQKAFLGFAPVFSNLSASKQRSLYPDLKRSLNALPLSRTEVEDLGNLFNKPHGFWLFLKSDKDEARIFEDSTATETRFKSLSLTNYRYIHLATHAYVSEDRPGQSGIVFAASADGKDDGILHASEIYNLRLAARLVTLSACNTGIGEMAKGEGIMSLSRAFQYAGARDLLVSLWNVDDRSTAKLMVDFYDRNEQDKSMAKALRDAKLSLIKNSRFAQPKYWAPFVFIGP